MRATGLVSAMPVGIATASTIAVEATVSWMCWMICGWSFFDQLRGVDSWLIMSTFDTYSHSRSPDNTITIGM